MIKLEGQDRDECLRLREKYYKRRVETGVKWHPEDLAEALEYREKILRKNGFNKAEELDPLRGCGLDMQCAIIIPLGNREVHEHIHA